MLKRNMWDHADYSCPIVGTCLTTAELRKLAARVQLILPPGATEYELHGCFVTLAKRPDKPAKIVQKYLDRKFSRQMKRFAKAQDDDTILALWTEMADAGNIPGAFWSVMRHQCASEQLLAKIYGEVHMLSHLVGASTRADLSRLAETQAKVDRLESALAERKTVLRDAVAVWKRRTMELERELAAERARREKAERERLSLRDLVEASSVAELERERRVLNEQLEKVQDRLLLSEAESRRQVCIIESNYREESLLRSQLAERDREVEALELALLASQHIKTPCGAACQVPDACRPRRARICRAGAASKASTGCWASASAARCCTTTAAWSNRRSTCSSCSAGPMPWSAPWTA